MRDLQSPEARVATNWWELQNGSRAQQTTHDAAGKNVGRVPIKAAERPRWCGRFSMPLPQLSDERIATTERKRIAKLVENIEKHEDDRVTNLVVEHAPTAATTLQQWHTLTRSRQWAGRVQRLANLLGPMGLADFQRLKEAFLQQPSLVASSPVHGSAELCSIAKQLESDERKCHNQVLEVAKRRLLAVLADLERETPMTNAESGVVHYRERRQKKDRERTQARQQGADQTTSMHTLHLRCSRAAVGTIVGKKGANLKRIGAKFGCKIIFSPSLECFELKSVDPEAGQRGKRALLDLEAEFNRAQAHWVAEKQRRKEAACYWQTQDLEAPDPETWKEDASSLWRRHQRGKRKAANENRQQQKIDRTRRSTAPGGRRSKPLKLADCRTSARVMKRLFRPRNKRPEPQMAEMQIQVSERTAPKQIWLAARKRRLQQQRPSSYQKRATVSNKISLIESNIAALQPAIPIDTATQQQWDLLARSRRWGGIVQQLANLLRPRFAASTPFALKQAFALCDTSDTTVAEQRAPVACADGKIHAVLMQLLASARPKRQMLVQKKAAEISHLDGEQHVPRLRLACAIELLLGGKLAQVKAMHTKNASISQSKPVEPEEKLSSKHEIFDDTSSVPKLCGAPAAA
eukprot:COSAG02_NODE_7356_length_3048_cov_8.873177_2_plen_634_part_00